MNEIMERLRKFNQDRDWDQYHQPANLAKSIVIESAELLECFQWDNDNFNKQHVAEELADVLCYAFQLADSLNMNITEIMNDKIDKNAIKYPIEKAKGSSKKYNEL
ncbi:MULTISPECIES: nucleotide pyrophosphohydrolase [unclassified Breznakia]|uniref:nucleotide pyrophosphohydrolase n=1 Tax=unclassified Breznakia TaxID=2623764 RepID=UPI0024751BC0|nr:MULTISPECIES: nucleotide pyrophosphohydrolase [unclassified Breznakia]MDH6366707.1 NTP pyrophosphatase (non-canonical NTP hydrolase) [Breznakia sp. PH1-1]MDH6403800.1 NTP pyrophosphatase (non-canonical NTP hydrolase) [Breznakia sp. PF1-11]MDH6411509.1 NTP pyrophosphatase (non-canonical NTP hydrolase) [Breznakia sp. PFB1-11]MDH6413760.1 NTP pyrophosphatase (non-canonical NTP hydrolase) [Breznakia sp. PFB1-14]MDH6416190.1 NTP pyrophosphatase (non-canonical NTP hydrolase) [Breznakia sp. PFB1-4